MKYKLLLCGNGKAIINDFFAHTGERFICMTTSGRAEDVKLHLQYFEPDVFIYCAKNELREKIERVCMSKEELEKKNVPFILVGGREDINNFSRAGLGIGAVKLALTTPISIFSVQDQVAQYIDEHRPESEEEKERIRIEAENRQAEKEKKRQQEEQEWLRQQEAKIEEKQREKEKKERTKKHILVIDDDAVMLRTIQRHLEGSYEVATAISGKLALKFLEKKETDLIFLDYEMPNMGGVEVMEMLQQNEKTADIPVVFLTGVTDVSKIQKALSMKPKGYLLKPINHEKLLDIINKVFG